MKDEKCRRAEIIKNGIITKNRILETIGITSTSLDKPKERGWGFSWIKQAEQTIDVPPVRCTLFANASEIPTALPQSLQKCLNNINTNLEEITGVLRQKKKNGSFVWASGVGWNPKFAAKAAPLPPGGSTATPYGHHGQQNQSDDATIQSWQGPCHRSQLKAPE